MFRSSKKSYPSNHHSYMGWLGMAVNSKRNVLLGIARHVGFHIKVMLPITSSIGVGVKFKNPFLGTARHVLILTVKVCF